MKVAIVGGGASGLVCAIEAARKGHQVSVFEKNSKVGRKILATGNGKCNISNQNITLSSYHGEQIHRIKELLKHFDTATCKTFFSQLGLEMKEGEEGRLYPMSHQASSVVDLLLHEARLYGVVFHLQSEVKDISKHEEYFILHVNEQTLMFDACVIATGSPAWKSLGSSESGYAFAKAFGLRVNEPFASLVQCVSDDEHLSLASGVKWDAIVQLYTNQQKVQEAKGDVLFTPYGLSGLAILELSRKASLALREHQKVHVIVDMFPSLSKEALQNLLQKRLSFAKGKSLALWLEGIIPKKLALFIIHREALLHVNDTSTLGTKELKKIVFALKALRVKLVATKGFESAEVCAGGVALDEMDTKTLMSLKCKNLYFCGEVLDVDGDCGGFNLHFAWASGYCVGKHIA